MRITDEDHGTEKPQAASTENLGHGRYFHRSHRYQWIGLRENLHRKPELFSH